MRDQFQYLFATPENKATFEKSPEKYEIQLSGACARMGGGVTGNPGRLRRRRRQDLHLRQRRLPQEVRRRAREVPAQTGAADALGRRRRCSQGRALVDRAVKAIGGAAKLDAVTTYVESSSQVQKRPDRRRADRAEDDVALSRRHPRRAHDDAAGPDDDERQPHHARGRVVHRPGARVSAERRRARDVPRRHYNRQLVPLLRARRDAGLQGRRRSAPATEDGVRGGSRPRPKHGARRRHARDRQGVGTGPQRVVHRPGLRVARLATTCIVLDDYRDVSGLRLPFSERASSTALPTRSCRARSTRSRSTRRSIPRSSSPAPAAANERLARRALAPDAGRRTRRRLAWPQWGGPNRNFVTGPADLARVVAGGRPAADLGSVRSATASRRSSPTARRSTRSIATGRDDVAVALDAKTGATRWATKYAAPFKETCSERLGPAPRAAPLLSGDRLITISAGGLMNSFDRATGQVQWTRDVLEGSPEALRACGYSNSPVAYKNTGHHHGRRTAGAASSPTTLATGKTAWQSQDFQNGYSSPIIIDLDGRPELIVFTYGEIAGLNPDTGALEWSRPHKSDQGVNVATPIWGDDHLLFISSAYGGGSRVLKLARTGDTVSVDEVWANQRVRIHFGNAVRIGEPDLRLERRHGVRAVRGRRRQDRRDAVAGSQRHAVDAHRRRQPARAARRGRQPRARDARATTASSCTARSSSSRSARGPRRR